jgi:hypothetical protein
MAGMEGMRQRIRRWRSEHAAYTRMPEDLWDGAVALARVDGAYAVARDFGVRYETLKRRVEESLAGGRAQGMTTGFVELDASEVFDEGGRAGTVVELSGADGTKLTVRLACGEKLDVAALTGTFLRRGT